jgi:glycerate dehydrogenase
MHIVVLDGHVLNPGDNPWAPLEQLGTVTVYPRTPPELVVERAYSAEILLTNKTPVPADVLWRLPQLRGICVLATGTNVVDVAAARARGVPVCNVPSYSTESVSQHVFALLLELTNRVALHDHAVRTGEWIRSPDFSFWRAPLLELNGRVLGIIGYGRIGARVAAIGRSFGMTVWATRPRSRRVEPLPWLEWRRRSEIFAGADVVSLHCALAPSTANLVNRKTLTTMKRDALLLNTARGGLVNEADLAWALGNGVIAGAALDVLAEEPMRPDCPLLTAPNCIVTPHVAWTSLPARQRLMQITADNIRSIVEGTPINTVAG